MENAPHLIVPRAIVSLRQYLENEMTGYVFFVGGKQYWIVGLKGKVGGKKVLDPESRTMVDMGNPEETLQGLIKQMQREDSSRSHGCEGIGPLRQEDSELCKSIELRSVVTGVPVPPDNKAFEVYWRY